MLVIVVLLAAVVVFFAIEHFKTLKREQKKKVGKRLGVFGAISALLLLLVTGKFAALAAIGTGLVVFAKRVFPFLTYLPFFKNLFNKIGTGSRGSSSQQSTVETSLLRMTLDHESGELDGELLDTVSKGKYLSDFGMSDLISLYVLAGTQYPDSTEVLATYLDRKYGDDWREAANAAGNSQNNTNTNENGKMTKTEAYEVLGLGENASEADVIAAHRKLMLKLHPDRGGSSYLAAKLNEAKDILLDGYGT